MPAPSCRPDTTPPEPPDGEAALLHAFRRLLDEAAARQLAELAEQRRLLGEVLVKLDWRSEPPMLVSRRLSVRPSFGGGGGAACGGGSDVNGGSRQPVGLAEARETVAKKLNVSALRSCPGADQDAVVSPWTLAQLLPRGFRFVLRSPLFDNFCGTLILINAVLVGIHAHWRAVHPEACEDITWEIIFLAFNIYFALELLLRIFAFGVEFFHGPDWRWNLFDSVIVISGVAEEVFGSMFVEGMCLGSGGGNAIGNPGAANGLTALRVFRAVRVARVVKAFRTMSIFRDLRVMVFSTLGCLVPFVWACLLIGFIQWCFAVYFLHFVTDSVAQAIAIEGPGVLDDESRPYKEARMYFGSMWSAVYTLFLTITGGINWADAAQVIFESTGMYHGIFVYVVFVALMVFAVLNVLTAIFVENATKVALRNHDVLLHDMLDSRNHFQRDALRFFRAADTDGSGRLTLEKFEAHMKDPRAQAFLEALELHSVGARSMFRLLGIDVHSSLSAEDFLVGCMCLRGDATTADIVMLLLEVQRLSGLVSSLTGGGGGGLPIPVIDAAVAALAALTGLGPCSMSVRPLGRGQRLRGHARRMPGGERLGNPSHAAAGPGSVTITITPDEAQLRKRGVIEFSRGLAVMLASIVVRLLI
eukprot:CAMPEP_0170213860 /NCGR_PEP_ID=MMETSP0116_2-20130129/6556_1 /TAXON_ID=400756 /ORGANISM="Durinskia baltica, Strain CSIRO CS-38" /LENGTH=643 /DNA_ID=CAMNT_0010464415 /DNA_START=12 /DNA_END=1942 /DNA_ORIENTATION=+